MLLEKFVKCFAKVEIVEWFVTNSIILMNINIMTIAN